MYADSRGGAGCTAAFAAADTRMIAREHSGARTDRADCIEANLAANVPDLREAARLPARCHRIVGLWVDLAADILPSLTP
jgi:hypothetical protein